MQQVMGPLPGLEKRCPLDVREFKPSPSDKGNEAFVAWIERVGNPFTAEVDVVDQMPFVNDGVRQTGRTSRCSGENY